MKYLLILFTSFCFGQFNPIFFASGVNPYSNLAIFLDAADPASYPGSGTLWTDLKGFQNCTLVNGVSFNSSNGGSLQFDGVNDYGNMGTALNFTTQNFSFSTWVYITSLTTTSSGQGPVIFSNAIFNSGGYYCQIGTNGAVNFATVTGGVTHTSTTNISDISAGNWYNISITKRDSSVKIYINGIDKTAVSSVHGNITTAPRSFHIGAYRAPDDAPPGVYSNIRVAKLEAFNKALSSSEVNLIFRKYKSVYGL